MNCITKFVMIDTVLTAPLKEIKAKINVLKFGKIHLKDYVIPDIKTHFFKISIEGN